MFEHKDQGRDLAIFESKVSQQINTYLNQEPRPSIEMIADYLGVYDLVQVDKRRGAKTLNIPEVKKEVARRTWEQAQKQQQDPKLPLLPEYIEKTVTPPDEGEIIPGSGKGIEAKRVFPRTQYLLELFQEHGIAFENPIAGRNSPHMMREDHTYFFFYIPSLHVAVNVNNQEGNATFVFHQVPDRDTVKNTLVPLSKKSYEDPHLNSYPMLQVNWTDDKESWKLAILDALTAPIQKTEKNELSATQTDQELDPKLQKYLAELKQAYEEWNAQPSETRKKLNIKWLEKNGFKQFYRKVSRHMDIRTLVTQAPEEIQKAFDVKDKKEKKSLEYILAELRKAYKEWKAQTPETRGKFNTNWLQKNGFPTIYRWTKENGGTAFFLSQIPEDIRQDLDIKVTPRKNIDKEVKKLEEAYENWYAQAPETRGKFNPKWLKSNGYNSLYDWAYKNGGIEILVDLAPQHVRDVFEKEERPSHVRRTPEIALLEINQAYQKWNAQPPDTRGNFNPTWLDNNEYSGLNAWAGRNGGIVKLVSQAPQQLQDTFTYGKV